jgi:ABC-type uncharacterized transport system substrate-binding protein
MISNLKNQRKYNRLYKASLLLPFFFASVFSHPHLFIDVSAKFAITDSGLSGIYTYWKLDEMNSAIIKDFYDKNNSGIFEKKELIEILKITLVNIQNVTTISYGTKFLSVEKIERFNAVFNGEEKIVYSFFIPCNISYKKLKGKKLTLRFSDPTIYIAFDLKKELIQAFTNEYLVGKISFRVVNYTDAVVFELKRKTQ